jgi:uncharacterized PurR-regulated membrane protein YhhQ (DUF165 family)
MGEIFPVAAPGSDEGARLVYLAIALSGLTALGSEVVWTRVLSLLFGATAYTFSLILAVFLVGLGIGSSLGAALARGVSRPRAALSALVAPPALVVASAVAFLLSELADFAVYTPLAQRRLVAAVVASSLVGLVVDSIVFLWLAFGSLDFLLGQVVGKGWMVLLSIPFVAWLRRRDEKSGMAPA